MPADTLTRIPVYTGVYGESFTKTAFPVPETLSLSELMREGGFIADRTILAKRRDNAEKRFIAIVRPDETYRHFDCADPRVALQGLDYGRRGDDAWDVYDDLGRVAAVRAANETNTSWWVRREHEGSILFPFEEARRFASHLDAYAYVCRSLLA